MYLACFLRNAIYLYDGIRVMIYRTVTRWRYFTYCYATKVNSDLLLSLSLTTRITNLR